jgi:hypothetical protein
MVAANRQNYVRLTWSGKLDRVVVRSKDRTRFSAVVRRAAAGCKVHDRKNQVVFHKQLENLVGFFGGWVHNRRTKLAKAFLTVWDSGLVFIIVSKERAYNASLERDLTQLDLKVGQSKDFSQICLSVQALPCCSSTCYEHFCNPQATLEFVGLDVE